MTVTSIRLASCAGALSIAAAAHADFRAALADYNAGRYEVAHEQFLELAELGDCSSQFNLGAMALKGQGGPKDAGSGVGWLRAAAANGCEQLVGIKLTALEPRLDAPQRRAADEIVARYGRDALRAQGIVEPELSCRTDSAATVLDSPAPEHPRTAGGVRRPALVIIALTIGVDGLARDPEILLALPEEGFAAAAVEAWLNSRFAPATRAGAPVESRLPAKLVFGVEGSNGPAGIEALRGARERAEAGDADGAYTIGLAGTLDASFGISSVRAAQLLLSAARDGDPRAQYWVGAQLRATSACHPRADGVVWLRHAAHGGSAAAQLLLAVDQLAGAPAAAKLAGAHSLLEQASGADSYYVRKHVAALLAASPLEAVRDPATALRVALKLAAGEIQSDPQMFETLAAAYAASGDFGNATASERIALRKAEALAWNTRLMKQRLDEYRAGRAWRGELLALSPSGAPGAQ
jgi:TPR repeat protein